MPDITAQINKCLLCPRSCVKTDGAAGFCGAGRDAEVAHIMLHKFEEPFISGRNKKRGSGAVFFARCTLRCVYCQNHKISRGGAEFKRVNDIELKDIFLNLQKAGAYNINLVTPTHYSLNIMNSVKAARAQGLNIPIVYNTSGYEKAEVIDALKETVDVYLTDFKYFDDAYAAAYSRCGDYFAQASKALKRMVETKGKPIFYKNGMLKSGVVVRHLTLPGLLADSKRVINYLYSEYGDSVILSIMNQYTPTQGLDKEKYPSLSRRVSKKQYGELIDYALSLGISNALIQEGNTAKESFIPDFIC